MRRMDVCGVAGAKWEWDTLLTGEKGKKEGGGCVFRVYTQLPQL